MKAGISLALFGSLLSLIIFLAIPSFARSSSYSSTMTTTTPASTNPSVCEPGTTTNATITTENGGSWRRSASEAVHNADVATEKAYNRAARDVDNLSLKGRVEAVLHENKSTRGSDVHVTADNGIVTLSGQVSSKRSARSVEEVVANVFGVKAVNNDLTYPSNRGLVTPPDTDSTGVAHPAYSDIAPVERAPTH
jgi:BON domain